MKVGYWGSLYDAWTLNFTNNARLQYRFNGGVPNQLTMSGNPFLTDQLGHAVRHLRAGPVDLRPADAARRPAVRLRQQFLPRTAGGPGEVHSGRDPFPATTGTAFKDLTPRIGATYDVFGNGKTAVKVSLGKYLEASSAAGLYTALNPINRVVTTTTRTWTDGNQNFSPDCDLNNPLAQDNRASGGDFCGAWGNQNFGKSVFDTNYDTAITQGWGNRFYNWDFGASVQHEIVPRLSATVGYFRRVYGNFLVTDNLAVAPSDYTAFSIPVPADPRLPGGGGTVLSGLYDVNPAKFGLSNNLVTAASNGGTQTEHWNGVDFTVDARLRNSLTVQGGFSTGRTVTDNCEIAAQVPESLFSVTSFGVANTSWSPAQNCHLETPFLTQFRGLGLVHDSESGPSRQRDVPEQARSAARGELQRAECRCRGLARPKSLGRRRQHPGEHRGARHALWRSDQPAGLPCREDPEVRPGANPGRIGPLQCAELERCPDVQSNLRPGVPDADPGAAGALREGQRPDRLLGPSPTGR